MTNMSMTNQGIQRTMIIGNLTIRNMRFLYFYMVISYAIFKRHI